MPHASNKTFENIVNELRFFFPAFPVQLKSSTSSQEIISDNTLVSDFLEENFLKCDVCKLENGKIRTLIINVN